MTDSNINKEDVKDEKELDSWFDELKNSRLKKAIIKAKWHSIFRNIFLILLVLAVVIIIGPNINRNIVQKMSDPVQIAVSEFNQISAPNKYIGKSSRYFGILNGRSEYTTYKIIEGKVVYTGEGEYNYGLFKSYIGNWVGTSSPSILGKSWTARHLDLQKYNELGQREIVFFYPFIDYPQYKKDLQLLDDISSNKVMELALSFDKSYSIEEVNKMLPENVTLSWYWIDDLDEQRKKDSKAHTKKQKGPDGTTYTQEYPPRLRSEWTAYGIKAYNRDGTPLEQPEQHFIRALKNGRKYDTRFKSEFERVFKNVAGKDGKITKNDIQVFGVVVTGDTKSLKELQGLPFIKATSLGVITDRY